MLRNQPKSPQVAPPASTGNAGSQFEAKVGAFYILSLLSNNEPRGLPGATIRTIEFQQRGSGHPLDDVIIQGVNRDGSAAVLEIQAKRTLTFTASDVEFTDVVASMWEAVQKPEFETSRYELAVAIARTTTRVEHYCQEVLHWARELPNGTTFAEHIQREKFSSKGMRDFVDVFRVMLAATEAPTDNETVWRMLRRFQILVFDFESPGSDYEHRARVRARMTLDTDQVDRASDLWPVIVNEAGKCARAGGALTRPEVINSLAAQYGFRFDQRADVRAVDARLSEAADRALDEINDQVGGVRLARTQLIEKAGAVLESDRILHIVGAPGVGKSSIMKRLARRLQPEGRIVVLRKGRLIQGGWLQMAHAIGCLISQDEFFNEIGCGGGATLFIDDIDQIEESSDWATVIDLLTGVAKNPGWRAVVTGSIGNDEWRKNLPSQLRNAGITTLNVEAISDDETYVLSDGNQALAAILNNHHPAQGIARNLFYLSKLIELGGSRPENARDIVTEVDLARLWWRYGGGRGEDSGRFARLKVLRGMGTQIISDTGHVASKTDDFASPALVELLRFDTLREDTSGATVTFQHDVLRDWTVGFLLHENEELPSTLRLDRPLPHRLARGLEIAARLAIESDVTGVRWAALLAVIESDGCHGSWKRPVLLALPRSEQALEQFQGLKTVLLDSDGRRLSEVIRLMIAVESESLAKVIARAQSSTEIPSGAGNLIVPKGSGWMWLVFWLVANAKSLPTALIPDASNVFQSWLVYTQNQNIQFNTDIVELLFEWLALIEDRMTPRAWRATQHSPSSLNISHLKDVRDEIRMTAFAFAHLNPQAAERYISSLNPDTVQHFELHALLCGAGSLPKAAPAVYVDFVLGTVIEKEDADDWYDSCPAELEPFDSFDHLFSPPSPDQGPFLELLECEPAQGLRLIQAVVEHATQWHRNQYIKTGQPFPQIAIPFPEGTKSFDGDWSVYSFARSLTSSAITSSALMALEAWGHRQIEASRPFEEVLHDVLGPDGSSGAFVAVAVDLVLSHWHLAQDVAWPMVATPELLQFDDRRLIRDLAGVDQIVDHEPEASSSRAKRADLDARRSRRDRLSDAIGKYVFYAEPVQLEALRAALEKARNVIVQKSNAIEDPINGIRATAERAVRMTNAEHWPLVKVILEDGSEVEVRQFEFDAKELELIDEETKRAVANNEHHGFRAKIQLALFDRVKSTADIVAEGIEWAKSQLANAQPQPVEEDEDEEFNQEWDQRVIIMAAALAARDYEASDRSDIVAWALPILDVAATEKGKEYRGNDQIEYNMAAIASLGLIALYLKNQEVTTRNSLLRLASHQHRSVTKALGCHFPELAQLDSRLPRSLIRITMRSSIHPRKSQSEQWNNQNQRKYEKAVDDSIVAEQRWLDGAESEPVWPELPAWPSQPRRRIRLGGLIEKDYVECEKKLPTDYLDEHALGALVSYLIRLTVGELPSWVAELAAHLMRWTEDSNGPHEEKDLEQDKRPLHWNSHFFEFLGILCVALPCRDALTKFLEPMTRFKDEAFHDAMAVFLRGFDRATRAVDARMPEDAAAIRARLADRIRQSRNYKRLGHEKGFTSESHAGDAMNAMYYQLPRFLNHGRPNIPDNWNGLDATIRTLTNLVIGAPSSGYLATLFLNLVESSPRAVLLPFVVQATSAWCSTYDVDTNFWSEKKIGARVCAWIDRTITEDSASIDILPKIADELANCLDLLIRSGIAQARELEKRIADMGSIRRTV